MRTTKPEDKIIAETRIESFFIFTELHNGNYSSVLVDFRNHDGWWRKPYSSEKEAIEGHENWCNYIRSKHGIFE
jgi:hypothetical protein